MTEQAIELTFTSRFKKTPLYTSSGKMFFGLWNPPEIKLDGNERVYKVSKADEGQLNLLAHREYGDQTLWWCIASVNKISCVEREVVSGVELILPKLKNIRAALREEENV